MTQIAELPPVQRRALELIKEVAVEKDCQPFLVGGPVRDLLLGRHSIDVDLTLEQGSSVLARALAKRVDGRVRSYPQFLTYKITAEGLPEIDIATARKERYRAPGALPAVSPGKLHDDLLRRDFSINAIALDLMGGTIHDPANGKGDLAGRSIRVLHEKSFLDDPTRIFRALRLAGRLSFQLDRQTEDLLHRALQSGALETVSRERLWRELFLAMEEEQAPAILRSFDHHGALLPILGRNMTGQAAGSLDQIASALRQREDLDRQVLYTGAIMQGAAAAQLEGSGLSQKRARAVRQIASELPRLEEALQRAAGERQRFRLLKSVSREMRAFLASQRPAQERNVHRYEEFRLFKIPLRGNELDVVPGPHVARALERTREAVFTGEIDPAQARSFAQELAVEYLGRQQTTDEK